MTRIVAKNSRRKSRSLAELGRPISLEPKLDEQAAENYLGSFDQLVG